MTDITAFLIDRYFEQEHRIAFVHHLSCPRILGNFTPEAVCDCGMPEMLRADLEAKRCIIERHRPVTELWNDGEKMHEVTLCGTCAYGQSCEHCFDLATDTEALWPCHELRLLASPFADHPDYDENWRL